jgi:hypothetical protein
MIKNSRSQLVSPKNVEVRGHDQAIISIWTEAKLTS